MCDYDDILIKLSGLVAHEKSKKLLKMGNARPLFGVYKGFVVVREGVRLLLRSEINDLGYWLKSTMVYDEE